MIVVLAIEWRFRFSGRKRKRCAVPKHAEGTKDDGFAECTSPYDKPPLRYQEYGKRQLISDISGSKSSLTTQIEWVWSCWRGKTKNYILLNRPKFCRPFRCYSGAVWNRACTAEISLCVHVTKRIDLFQCNVGDNPFR